MNKTFVTIPEHAYIALRHLIFLNMYNLYISKTALYVYEIYSFHCWHNFAYAHDFIYSRFIISYTLNVFYLPIVKQLECVCDAELPGVHGSNLLPIRLRSESETVFKG